LINVAFITLFERKILGLRQSRKGPNKVSFWGILQPFADAVKLFLKQKLIPFSRNFRLFLLSPLLALVFILILWSLISFKKFELRFSLSILFFLIILRINVYPLIITGWASNRKYSLIGAIRGVAQTISYEVSLALIILGVLRFSISLRVLINSLINKNVSFLLFSPLFILWIISCVAETNRTPFDFAEGESELVSGFNTEYGSGVFALIFIAEYGIILLLRIMRVNLFLYRTVSSIFPIIWIIILRFLWIWLRATYPRYRYDILINLAWKSVLPLTIGFLLFYRRILFLTIN